MLRQPMKYFLQNNILDSIGDYDFRKEVAIFQSKSEVPRRKQSTTVDAKLIL